LYIELPYTENQIEEQGSAKIGPRVSADQHEALLVQLERSFQALHAEEFHIEPTLRHTVRVWWD
jgi:hypothetical protein